MLVRPPVDQRRLRAHVVEEELQFSQLGRGLRDSQGAAVVVLEFHFGGPVGSFRVAATLRADETSFIDFRGPVRNGVLIDLQLREQRCLVKRARPLLVCCPSHEAISVRSLPKACLMATSQLVAALTNMSFCALATAWRAEAPSLGSSVSHQTAHGYSTENVASVAFFGEDSRPVKRVHHIFGPFIEVWSHPNLAFQPTGECFPIWK